MRRIAYLPVFAVLLCLLPAARADTETGEGRIEGEIELAHRNVDVDGEHRKYDEDFDGMASGTYLGHLNVSWLNEAGEWLDFARVNLEGLGGEPYQRSGIRLGKKDSWELRFDSTKQDYMYNLFELVGNEDGTFWDSQRRRDELSLKIQATDNIKAVVQYRNNHRTGDSIFMKDLNRELFRFEAPLDVESESVTVGIDAKFGKVNLVFRQALNDYTNNILNETEGDLGVDLVNPAQLDSYHWRQRDNTESDWTTLILHAPVAKRLELTLSAAGTLLGDEEVSSDVTVEQLGLDFNGNEYGGTCAIGGAPCGSDATCDAINAGDVCVASTGTSTARMAGDTIIVDFGASIRIAAPLTAHLNYKTYSRELDGVIDRDLDGDGAFEDPDGDLTPGSITRIDHQVDTVTALLDYRPSRKVGVRAGYRTMSRSIERSGFGSVRDTDFDSDNDKTLLLGVSARPLSWLRLNADYEDAEMDMAFTNVSQFMRQQTRVRATIVPRQAMRLNLTFRDWENENISSNFRPAPPAIDNNGKIDGTTWSVDWTHAAGDHVNYLLRYTEHEVEGSTAILFDTAGFGAVAPGTSDFMNDNSQFQGRVDYRRDKWHCYVMASSVDSDGFNDVIDLTFPTPSLVNSQLIMQTYDDAEIGINYLLPSGLSIGGAYRHFDYDDVNNLLDYDGRHVTVRAGLKF
jgi:hypothetical protein